MNTESSFGKNPDGYTHKLISEAERKVGSAMVGVMTKKRKGRYIDAPDLIFIVAIILLGLLSWYLIWIMA